MKRILSGLLLLAVLAACLSPAVSVRSEYIREEEIPETTIVPAEAEEFIPAPEGEPEEDPDSLPFSPETPAPEETANAEPDPGEPSPVPEGNETAEQTATPSSGEETGAEEPEQPDDPEDPEDPVTAETPENPEEPVTAENPEDPADIGVSENPQEPEEPDPVNPEPPEEAAAPEEPADAGETEQTGHPDQGYIEVSGGTKVYSGPSEEALYGVFTEDAVVYARTEEREADPDRDWLRITFDTEDQRAAGEALLHGYLRAEKARFLSEEETERIRNELSGDPDCRETAGNRLPAVSFRPEETETENPDGEDGADRSADAGDPRENGDTGPEEPEEIRETEPEPGQEDFTEQAETGVKTAEEKARIQKKLKDPFTSGKGVTVHPETRALGSGGLPESDHPYDSNEDRYWTLAADGEAAAVSVTFSEETFVEDGYDFIILYNAQGGIIGTYTGSELSGRTIMTAGDEITIRLVSDSLYTEYGFSLTDCTFLQQIPIGSITLKTGPKVTLSWSAPFCTVGYEIQRAVVNPATGAVGTYQDIGTAAAETFTDQKVSWGMVYSYRIRAYKTLVYNGQSYRYYTGFSEKETYIVRTPQIRSGFGSKWYQGTVISWDAVQGAAKYIVYRAETANGTYVRIGETTALTWTDLIPEKKNYYYKLRIEANVRGTVYVSLPSGSFMAGYLGKPSGLEAQPAGGNAVRLQWKRTEGAAGYVVYRSLNPDSGYQYVTTTPAETVTTYAPEKGKVYYYRIKAFTPAKTYSGFSDAAGVLPMDAPQNVRRVTHTKTSVTLRWDPVPGATAAPSPTHTSGPTVATPQPSEPSGAAPTRAPLFTRAFSPRMANCTSAPDSTTAPGISTLYSTRAPSCTVTWFDRTLLKTEPSTMQPSVTMECLMSAVCPIAWGGRMGLRLRIGHSGS